MSQGSYAHGIFPQEGLRYTQRAVHGVLARILFKGTELSLANVDVGWGARYAH